MSPILWPVFPMDIAGVILYIWEIPQMEFITLMVIMN